MGVRSGRLEGGERSAAVAERPRRERAERLRGDLERPPEALGVRKRAREQRPHLLLRQGLQDKKLQARAERAGHLERRVFGGRPDQGQGAVLDEGQEQVLLRLVKAVHLVQKEERLPPLRAPLGRLGGDGAHLLDPSGHRGEPHEVRPAALG